jgi:hypothetical protein
MDPEVIRQANALTGMQSGEFTWVLTF